MVAGLFVLFNMFYLQPKLADSSVSNNLAISAEKAPETENSSAADAATVVVKKAKMNEARRMMIYILAGVLFFMTASRFLYGISSNFEKPTCFVLLFTGEVLTASRLFSPC